MNEIVKKENLPVHVDAMTLVAAAVEKGAALDQVDKLIELVKFNDSREALRAFNTDFTKAQAEFPVIKREGKVDYTSQKGRTNYNHAKYSDIVSAIKPVLMKYGLSFRHEVKETDALVVVRCILAHHQGHSVEAQMSGPRDTSGNKNALQAIGSAVTYLKRYTLEAVTGVVTSDEDDDAQSCSEQAEKITTDQVIQINDLIKEITDKETKEKKPKVLNKEAVLKHYKVMAFEDMDIKKFGQAMASLEERKAR